MSAWFTPAAVLLTVAIAAPAAAQSNDDTRGRDAQLGASFVGNNGNAHTATVGADFSMNDRRPPWTFEAGFNAVRNSTRDQRGIEQKVERYLESARLKRRLSTMLAFTTGQRFEHDPVAGVDVRSIVDAGLGWKLVQRPTWTLDGITALAWNHERPVASPDGPMISRDDPIGLLQLLNKIAVGKSGNTTQRFTAYPNFGHSELARLEGELTAQAAMSDRLALKLGYLVRYSNTPLARLKSTDSTATASVVLTWKTPATKP